MKKKSPTTAILTACMILMLLSGCSVQAARTPVPTNAKETPRQSTMPELPASQTTEPVQTSAPSYIYISTTDEMTPEMEKSLLEYNREGDDAWNTEFTGATKTDLDGDGQTEIIQLLPGKANTDLENRGGDFIE